MSARRGNRIRGGPGFARSRRRSPGLRPRSHPLYAHSRTTIYGRAGFARLCILTRQGSGGYGGVMGRKDDTQPVPTRQNQHKHWLKSSHRSKTPVIMRVPRVGPAKVAATVDGCRRMHKYSARNKSRASVSNLSGSHKPRCTEQSSLQKPPHGPWSR